MPATVLARNISNALKSNVKKGTESGIMNQTIATEITKYLKDNVKVQVSYAGVVGDSPEAGVDALPITGEVSPSIVTDAVSWLNILGHNIATGFQTLPGVVKPQGTHISLKVPSDTLHDFVPMGQRKNVHSTNDPCYEFWLQVSQGIFKMISTQVSDSFPAGIAGSGIATVTKLIIT
jgi:hypothetical protein